MKRVVASLFVLAGLALYLTSPVGAAQSADNAADVDAGRSVYESNCAGCHGADGTGSDRGRPLIGIADQGDRARHITSIVDGRGSMPGFGDALEDNEIEQVASFVRLSFVATDDGDSELALTGNENTLLAVVGVSMILVGLPLVAFQRRTTD